jgi:hypothetical protein
MTLHIKQYGEYQLPALHGRPEFLQKINTFVTPPCDRCEESQLSEVSNTGSINSLLLTIAESQLKIANISPNSKPNLKSLQIPSKGLGRNPFIKIRDKKSRWTLPLKYSNKWTHHTLSEDPLP